MVLLLLLTKRPPGFVRGPGTVNSGNKNCTASFSQSRVVWQKISLVSDEYARIAIGLVHYSRRTIQHAWCAANVPCCHRSSVISSDTFFYCFTFPANAWRL